MPQLPPAGALSQHVLGEDLKATDVEVGVCAAGLFRRLRNEEVEEHLVAISERD